MSRIAYVNGAYVPHNEAAVHIEDRGYQFSDGVYEVCFVANGLLLDEEGHLDRLDRSLAELRIAAPLTRKALRLVMREMIRRNRVVNGLVYLQATRGVARRNHAFPTATAPSLVLTARNAPALWRDGKAEKGVGVITVPDERWKRPYIKSVSLLPNVLAKQAAVDAGAGEAWFVDAEGFITEGSSTNAWIVSADGVLITRPAESDILKGITRTAILEIAAAEGYEVVERPFSPEEVRVAREAFMSAATAMVTPIVSIDGESIANGAPGRFTLKLRELYKKHSLNVALRLENAF
ncbi:MAG: D-amino-acid transaminase [Pseudomonadota bacterium]